MFRVVNVKYHRAKKSYKYYGGVIHNGDYYYRGFGVDKNNTPFEFFFTDDRIFDARKISTRILYDEYVRYWNTRNLRAIGLMND